MIRFERHGGVGGLTLRAALAAEELTSEEAEALEALRAHPPSGAAGPDRFQYRLAWAEDEVVVPEGLVPDVLRGLFSRLVARAKSGGD